MTGIRKAPDEAASVQGTIIALAASLVERLEDPEGFLAVLRTVAETGTGVDLDDLRTLIADLVRLRTVIESDEGYVSPYVEAVLATQRGRQIEAARERFSDFEDSIRRSFSRSSHSRYLSQYEFSGRDYRVHDLKDEDYDPNAICTLNINLIEVDDGVNSYGRAHTKLHLSFGLDGVIEYKFEGAEIDPVFKEKLLILAKGISSRLNLE